MLPFFQILIYLFCIYLCFKGLEIFQTAYVSESPHRRVGLLIGVAAIVAAGIVGAGTVGVTEFMVYKVTQNWTNMPLPRY
jgi:hypothetical protein